MAYIYFLLFTFFLYNIEGVLSVSYSCNRSAECGCSKVNANVNKIVGGESAVDSSWGWAVSLQLNSNNAHFCGGAIISPSYIITAAHCIPSSSFIIQYARVVVGINKLSETGSTIAQERSIVSVVLHPGYNDNTKVNDIAVLRLNRPLDISNGKGNARLCLPRVIQTGTANNYPIPDLSLVAIGWGLLRSGNHSIPPNQHLQQVTLTSMSADHRMCRTTISNRQLQFCAGIVGGGKGKRMTINPSFFS